MLGCDETATQLAALKLTSKTHMENTMNILPVMKSLTMTSREIAELTGKRHDNVLRDIDELLKEICIADNFC